MADITPIQSNTSVEPTTQDVAAPEMVQPTIDDVTTTDEGGGPGDHKKGATSTEQDNTIKYDQNSKFMSTLIQTHQKRLIDFVNTTAQITGKRPVLNGKSLDKDEDLIKAASNASTAEQLYKQSLSVFDNPEYIGDQYDDILGGLLIKQKKVDDVVGYMKHANNIINKDLHYAAEVVDAKIAASDRKGQYDSHSLLFDKEGDFLSADKYAFVRTNRIIDANNETLRQAKESLPPSEEQNQRNAILNYMNAGKPGWKNLPVVAEKTGFQSGVKSKENPYGVIVPTNLREGNSIANLNFNKVKNDQIEQARVQLIRNAPYQQRVTLKNYKESGYYQGLLKEYDDSKKRVIEEYNKNGKTSSLKTKSEDIINQGSAGGTSTVSNMTYQFNLDEKQRFDYDPQTLQPTGYKKDLQYVVDFVNNIKNIPDAIFTKGAIGSEIPSTGSSDKDSKQMIAYLSDKMSNMLKYNTTKGMGTVPIGELTFQPIAGGNEKYQAFNLKLNPEYYKEYKGTKTEPGSGRDEEMQANGITIYVPKESAIKAGIQISKVSKEASTPSFVEGTMALDPDKTYTRVVPNGMTYTIKKDPAGGGMLVTGYGVKYNTKSHDYDTIPIQKVFSYGLDRNMDGIEKDLFKLSLQSFITNRQIKRLALESNGVKDPNQLKGSH